jgi:hypothetical protein
MDVREQQRRDLKASDPDLYAYIAVVEQRKILETAFSLASGAVDGHGAANRISALSARLLT